MITEPSPDAAPLVAVPPPELDRVVTELPVPEPVVTVTALPEPILPADEEALSAPAELCIAPRSTKAEAACKQGTRIGHHLSDMHISAAGTGLTLTRQTR